MTTLQVTIPEEVRAKAEEAAREKHVSLDEFTTLALIQSISASLPDPYLEERATRGDLRRFKEILASVPDVPPEDYDKIE
jgi:hypothetical protein